MGKQLQIDSTGHGDWKTLKDPTLVVLNREGGPDATIGKEHGCSIIEELIPGLGAISDLEYISESTDSVESGKARILELNESRGRMAFILNIAVKLPGDTDNQAVMIGLIAPVYESSEPRYLWLRESDYPEVRSQLRIRDSY